MLCNGGISPICQCWAYTLITMRSETALLHPGCIHMCVYVCVCVCVCVRDKRDCCWYRSLAYTNSLPHQILSLGCGAILQCSTHLTRAPPLSDTALHSSWFSLCGTGRRRDIWRICRGEWGSVLYWRSRKDLKPGSRGLMLIPWPFYQGLHFTLKLPLPCGSPLRSAVKFPPLGLKVIMAWYPPRILNDRDIC